MMTYLTVIVSCDRNVFIEKMEMKGMRKKWKKEKKGILSS